MKEAGFGRKWGLRGRQKKIETWIEEVKILVFRESLLSVHLCTCKISVTYIE